VSETDQVRAARPARGAELELSVESLAHGGSGVARHDGFVVFVHGGMPGDRVRAEVVKAKRGYAEARLVELIEPSPDRIAPRAAHPGAPWQVLPYERQLEEKERQVREALARLGGFEAPQGVLHLLLLDLELALVGQHLPRGAGVLRRRIDPVRARLEDLHSPRFSV